MSSGFHTVADFSRWTLDRSRFDLTFDGAKLDLVIESATAGGVYTRLTFDWVAYFTFESVESMLDFVNAPSEALIEIESSAYIEARRHLAGAYFGEGSRYMSLFLLDIGVLNVVCKGVTIAEE